MEAALYQEVRGQGRQAIPAKGNILEPVNFRATKNYGELSEGKRSSWKTLLFIKSMHILHLFSNWKWTGPAEPALNLALMLNKRRHHVSFLSGRTPRGEEESLEKMVLERGLAPDTRLFLRKHFNIFDNLIDLYRLISIIKGNNFDLIHTHLTNDHLLAGLAIRASGKQIPLVRTCYDGDNIKVDWRNKLLFSQFPVGLILVSKQERDFILNNFSITAEKVWNIDTGVDINRFNPGVINKDFRTRLGILPEDIVVGVVARIQRHRRFEVLLQALKIVIKDFPRIKLMVVGRGTHMNELAVSPAKEMGIDGNIIFTGYRRNDYVLTLSCMDIKVFLVPGSDGSCRAVKEAMAMGKPVIAARRGMLPEIVEDGKDGMVIEDTPFNLARAILKLAKNEVLRRRMGKAAVSKARTVFSLDFQTDAVEKVYQELCSNLNIL